MLLEFLYAYKLRQNNNLKVQSRTHFAALYYIDEGKIFSFQLSVNSSITVRSVYHSCAGAAVAQEVEVEVGQLITGLVV